MSARIIVQAWKSNIAEGFEDEAPNPLAFVFDDLCVCVCMSVELLFALSCGRLSSLVLKL